MSTKINNVPLSQLTLASHAQCHQEVTALGETSADALYHQVVDTVNAYTLIQPAAEITDFVARMNVIVAKYRNVVANQAKTKKEEK